MLLIGASIVPGPELTLQPGDRVVIAVTGLGRWSTGWRKWRGSRVEEADLSPAVRLAVRVGLEVIDTGRPS